MRQVRNKSEIFMSSICSATFVRIGSKVFKFVDTNFESLDSLKRAHEVDEAGDYELHQYPAISPIFQNLAGAHESPQKVAVCTCEVSVVRMRFLGLYFRTF